MLFDHHLESGKRTGDVTSDSINVHVARGVGHQVHRPSLRQVSRAITAAEGFHSLSQRKLMHGFIAYKST